MRLFCASDALPPASACSAYIGSIAGPSMPCELTLLMGRVLRRAAAPPGLKCRFIPLNYNYKLQFIICHSEHKILQCVPLGPASRLVAPPLRPPFIGPGWPCFRRGSLERGGQPDSAPREPNGSPGRGLPLFSFYTYSHTIPGAMGSAVR